MNPPSLDIRQILAAESSITGSVSPVTPTFFYENLPDEEDVAVLVTDSGGFDPLALEVVYDKPTVQVLVRAKSYSQGYSLIKACASFLHKKTDETINSTRYIAIWQMSDIISLGTDDSKRNLLSVNFRIHRTA
jgi:hypothetical protein